MVTVGATDGEKAGVDTGAGPARMEGAPAAVRGESVEHTLGVNVQAAPKTGRMAPTVQPRVGPVGTTPGQFPPLTSWAVVEEGEPVTPTPIPVVGAVAVARS